MLDSNETLKTTSRKPRTLRRTNAATDERTPSTSVEAPQDQAKPETSQPAGSVVNEKAIVLLDSRMTQLTESWSKSVARDARAVVTFAIEKMVGTAESKMAIGEKFNDFATKHPDKVQVLIKETAKLGVNGLTESNIRLWQIRAAELPKHIPNPLVRKYVLAMTGGEGLIIRDESYDEKSPDGKPLPKPYILSPFYAEAIKTIGPVSTTTDEEVAEMQARKYQSQATFLRSKARTEPEDARIKKQFATFQKRCIGWLKKHESLVWDRMAHMIGQLAKETTDLKEFEACLGKMDKLFDAVSEANGDTKAQARSKVA